MPSMDTNVDYSPGGYTDQLMSEPDGLSPDNAETLDAAPDPMYRPSPLERGGRVPHSVIRNLPRIVAAAKDPEMNPSFKALYGALVRKLAG